MEYLVLTSPNKRKKVISIQVRDMPKGASIKKWINILKKEFPKNFKNLKISVENPIDYAPSKIIIYHGNHPSGMHTYNCVHCKF
ncbi:MAG: hypothetical protein Athens071416_345 [Parcubacteria group bacterium Athens0714_16]|nr:MAG: hypothetical protein Athens071416_345 [Parcubacteria group bacterium Athens0714_16]